MLHIFKLQRYCTFENTRSTSNNAPGVKSLLRDLDDSIEDQTSFVKAQLKKEKMLL